MSERAEGPPETLWRGPGGRVHREAYGMLGIMWCGRGRKESRWPDGFCTLAGWRSVSDTVPSAVTCPECAAPTMTLRELVEAAHESLQFP